MPGSPVRRRPQRRRLGRALGGVLARRATAGGRRRGRGHQPLDGRGHPAHRTACHPLDQLRGGRLLERRGAAGQRRQQRAPERLPGGRRTEAVRRRRLRGHAVFHRLLRGQRPLLHHHRARRQGRRLERVADEQEQRLHRGVAVAGGRCSPASRWTVDPAGGEAIDGQARFVDLEAPLAPDFPAVRRSPWPTTNTRVVLSPDGKRLAIANAGRRVPVGRVRAHHTPARARGPAHLEPAGRRLGTGVLAVGPAPGGGGGRDPPVPPSRSTAPAAAAVGGREDAADHRPFALAFSPDGRGLAVGLVACGVLVYCRD